MSGAVLVKPGSKFSLKKVDADSCDGFSGKDDPKLAAQMKKDIDRLSDLQEILFAEKKTAVLVVLQAMDTAGKDGTLRHVVGPLDNRGVRVESFGPPSREDLDHDYLWRVHRKAPRKGEIVFWNRSHYEDVLVVRVEGLVSKSVWSRRYEQINAFEQMLSEEGTRIVKIFLHISKEEQKRRLQERLDEPEKRWKFDPSDLEARQKWDDYQEAYDDVFSKTSTKWAPWHVVPADRKWFRDQAVARVLVDLLEDIDPKVPAPKVDWKKIVIP